MQGGRCGEGYEEDMRLRNEGDRRGGGGEGLVRCWEGKRKKKKGGGG